MIQSRQYELVYIVSPDVSEQEVVDLHTQIEGIVSRFGGQIDRSENWGRRKLAYEIDHHKEGVYVLEVISGPGEVVRELDRRLRVVDHVIRHLVVRVDRDQRIAERAAAKRKAGQKRGRLARGLPPGPEAGERAAADERGGDHAADHLDKAEG